LQIYAKFATELQEFFNWEKVRGKGCEAKGKAYEVRGWAVEGPDNAKAEACKIARDRNERQ